MILRERFKCLLKNLKYIKQERGAVFVLTAILLPVLFGCLGIGYDVGNVYMHKARLQNIADAAALAGGRAYLQSQLKIGDVHIDTYDTYTNGNVTDVEYVVGSNGGISTTRDGHHPDADIAADKYIRNNIINLGEKVYSDKYSHYALRGLKKVGEDYVYDSKIFYRIGLFEKVPLHFLPVITNKNIETVRAGSVVVIEPGTPGTEPGNPTSKDNSGVTSPSIFDNLFTFSEWLFTRNLTLNDGTVEASFDGTMVYTHLNNTADVPSSLYQTLQPSRYFHYEADNGSASDEFQYTHMYENSIGSNVSTSAGTINDPYIDTFYDTKAYLEAFKSKLDGPHFDVRSANDFTGENALRIVGNTLSSATCRVKYAINSGIGQGNYYKIGNDYFLLNPNGEYTTFQSNGKTYTICYHKIPNSNYVVRCGKVDDDSTYYMLTSNNRITNCYIKWVQYNEYYGAESTYININNVESALNFNGSFVDSSWQPISDSLFSPSKPETPIDISNFQALPSSGDGINTNIYHVLLPRLHNENDSIKNLEIVIDNPIQGNDLNEPVYVLIDGINQVTIKGSANMTTGRPLILVFLSEGTTQLKYEYTGDFFGTIYAPVSTFEHAKGSGSFVGNIIAKTINIQSSTKIAWKQENHLEKFKYTYVEDPTGDYVLENGNYRKVTDGETITGKRYKKVQVFNYIEDSNGDYVLDNGTYRKAKEGETGTHRQVPVYAYLDQAIKTVSDQTAAKIEKANQDLETALQEQNTTLEKFTENIYTKLGLSNDEIAAAKADSNWYNNQTFGRKKTLYTKWRALYDSYPANSPLRNLLWPWNEHFGIDTEEDEIAATPETLRLINFRTEYQLKENMNNDDVVDPFIFETLRQPNSY